MVRLAAWQAVASPNRIPDSEWTDQIASRAGRELLAYAEIDEADAIKAAS